MKITAEEFAAWREDPVTRAVSEAFAEQAKAQGEAWFAHSWSTGECDPVVLNTLRTRADAYRAIAELTFEDLGETE